MRLPIDDHLDAITERLKLSCCLLIEAPPGTGKTTRVAPALLRSRAANQDSTNDKRILLVQPRRIAASASARRIADEMNCNVGGLVGYHVRFDRQTSAASRIVCLTPGILLRRLQSDPILEDIEIVILDEFHERSLDYDLLLGMLRRVQSELRPDLKLVVMSATVDTASVMEYLPEAERIVVEAETFPVSIRNAKLTGQRKVHPSRRIVEAVSDAILDLSGKLDGDILAFLPGAGEIHQVERALTAQATRHDWRLLPLYGSMRAEDQEAVLRPGTRRKVILATNIAETSLTIDGVRVVVDGGYARVQRSDPSTGLNRLSLEPISQASARQRAGRAGRTAPGVCFQIWDEATGRSRASHTDAEILRVDLTSACLQLICWGESDIAAFPWITHPKPEAVSAALSQLEMIGGLTGSTPTAMGKTLVQLPTQPRLGRLLLEGRRLGIESEAAVVAAILSERDIIDARASGAATPASAASECDLQFRVDLLAGRHTGGGLEINRSSASQVQRAAKQLVNALPKQPTSAPVDASASTSGRLQQALLQAFPDRVARRRSPGSDRGIMVGGRGVRLAANSSVRRSEFFLCLDVDAKGADVTVRMASGIDAAWLVGSLRRSCVQRFFNPTVGAVVSRSRELWADLVLSESPTETPMDQETAEILATAAAAKFEQLLPKSKSLHRLLKRIGWLADQVPELGLPDFSVQSCRVILENLCFGLRSIDELKKLPWEALIPAQLNSTQRRQLDQHAPAALDLPKGRRVELEYEIGRPPVLKARIQELFGWPQTPKLAGGKIPLLIHLLAPNGRVHQITDDLASFWANTYSDVRKQLRGRYPKHAWPENPLTPPPER